MSYRILDAKTKKVLAEKATPTPFMLCWKARTGPAIVRNGIWYAADYPGFEKEITERARLIIVQEYRD